MNSGRYARVIPCRQGRIFYLLDLTLYGRQGNYENSPAGWLAATLSRQAAHARRRTPDLAMGAGARGALVV